MRFDSQLILRKPPPIWFDSGWKVQTKHNEGLIRGGLFSGGFVRISNDIGHCYISKISATVPVHHVTCCYPRQVFHLLSFNILGRFPFSLLPLHCLILCAAFSHLNAPDFETRNTTVSVSLLRTGHCRLSGVRRTRYYQTSCHFNLDYIPWN
jgi:hypothetical protein